MSPSLARRVLLCLSAIAVLQAPAHAYLKLGSSVNGRTISLQWPARTPVRYFISDGGAIENIRDNDRRALFGEFSAISRADVARAAGNDGNPPSQSHLPLQFFI